jgi:hypothetical protein
MQDILLRMCCTRPDSVPAAELEELLANGTTGVTCNKKLSMHIQTIKHNLKDFNSHREHPDRGSIPFTKESAGNIASKICYKTSILKSHFQE